MNNYGLLKLRRGRSQTRPHISRPGMRAGLRPAATKLMAAVLLLWLVACGQHEHQAKIPTPVKVKTAEKYSAANDIRYSANIQPKNQVSLAFKVGGYIES